MINSVRNTVLAVLNKNNYGYISPSDFNLFAKQAQMELYEEYFSQYNKVVNMENARMSGTHYANLRKTIEEVLEVFSVTNNLTQDADNKYFLPSLLTTGNEAYMINKVLYSNGGKFTEVEKVNQSKITMLVNSNLTSPTKTFPCYSQEDGIITIYPETIDGDEDIVAQYFRYPKDPKWTYITLGNGAPIFNSSQPDYQDFELPAEDEYKLIMKILQYCGVSIRENEVVQFGMAQEQHEQPTFSQQQ